MPGERSDLFVGCVGALILVTVHIGFEWLFVTSVIHYLLAMNFGMMIGIAASLRRRSVSAVRQQPSAVPAGLASHPG